MVRLQLSRIDYSSHIRSFLDTSLHPELPRHRPNNVFLDDNRESETYLLYWRRLCGKFTTWHACRKRRLTMMLSRVALPAP